ncbi:MAG: endonuclease III [Nitrospirae bacterium]|nr:MAG: endonuclease III [Nitrospirota bacterium]
MADVKAILKKLFKAYPEPRIELEHSNPLELLVATILSAQCTDQRVNEVTRRLFKKYRTPKDYAEADPKVFEQEIKPTGFYKNKTRQVLSCCKDIVERFGGRVPDNLEDLTSLSGVGRKTANVVLGVAFGKQAIAVDTHVLRVSRRLGLTSEENPDKVEFDLMKKIPEDSWTRFTLAMILHGRRVCKARKPNCSECALYEECQWEEKTG